MISNFQLVVHTLEAGNRSLIVVNGTVEKSENVLAVARDLLKKEQQQFLVVMIRYTEDKLKFNLCAYDLGDNTVEAKIEIEGPIHPPETILADVPGRMLSDLIQGSSVVDEVIGNRVIVECHYDADTSCLTVLLEAKEGWWFMR